MKRPEISLVVETENLSAIGADVAGSCARLLDHLTRQTFPLSAAREVLVVHEGLSEEDEHRLVLAARRPLRFVRVARGTDHYEAKNRAFEAARGDVVAFADGDCWPCAAWLASLVAPFEDARVSIVAGRTTYAPGLLGDALTAVDFSLSPRKKGTVSHFFANNVALRRAAFLPFPYPVGHGTSRGACGALAMSLRKRRVPITFAPAAHTVHRAPESLREVLASRMSRGRDLAVLTPEIAAAHLPQPLSWVGRARSAPLLLLLGREIVSLRALGVLPKEQRASRAALTYAITALDALGARSATRRKKRPQRAA